MVYLILVLALVLRLIALNQSFWLDEAAQAVISSQNFLKVNWAADFQPPLYYIIAKAWMQFSITHEWFLRLPSVFFGVAAVYMSYYFFKKLFGEKVGLVSALFLATAPFHIYYSQEFRMYSLITLFSLISWMFLWQKKWKYYAVVTALSIFTHYFAFLIIVSQASYILLFRRKSVHKFSKYLGLGIAPFILWLPIFIQQIATSRQLVAMWPKWSSVSNASFLKFPGLTLAKFTVGMMSPTPRIFYGAVVVAIGIIFTISLGFIILSLIKSILLRYKLKKQPLFRFQIVRNFFDILIGNSNKEIALLFSYFFFPLILAWIAGLWISASSPWRVQFVLPAFYAIIALGLLGKEKSASFTVDYRGIIHLGIEAYKFLYPYQYDRLKKLQLLNGFTSIFSENREDKVKKLLLYIVIFVNIFFSLSYVLNKSNHREDWKGAVAYTDEIVGSSGIVVTEFNNVWAPIQWYSIKPDHYMGGSATQKITPQSVQDKLESRIQNSDVWMLYTYLFEISDPEQHIASYLEDGGFRITEEKDFRGVGIIQTYLKD